VSTISSVFRVALALVALALLAACGGQEVAHSPAGASASKVGTQARLAEPAGLGIAAAAHGTVPECVAGEERRLGDEARSYAAIAKGAIVAFKAPDGGRAARFDATTSLGFPTMFGVLAEVVGADCAADWYRVQFPVRPNGTEGYVSADDVTLRTVTRRIEVDLSERRLDLLEGERRLMRVTIAVGAPDTPTPTGRFFVNQLIRVTQPDGPYGPAALGLSGFSPVLTFWPEGGPIAIHGTNDPSSIGRAASNGCLRVRNDELLRMFELVPAGTPVTVVL
jgi:lipoprotein-anchoring transpeptidase ErfK/SrfK